VDLRRSESTGVLHGLDVPGAPVDLAESTSRVLPGGCRHTLPRGADGARRPAARGRPRDIESAEATVSARLLPGGEVTVSLRGGSFRDQAAFADAVGEVLGPVGNPRYLITRRARGRLGERTDYHAVPSLLATNRDLARRFHRAWRALVGPGDLLYARAKGGRAVLLEARGRALANQLTDPGRRLDRWP